MGRGADAAFYDRGASGEVEPVVVAEGFRGRGVGRQLFDQVAAEAVSRRRPITVRRPGLPGRGR